MMVKVFKPSTWEDEASPRLIKNTLGHCETLSQRENKQTKKQSLSVGWQINSTNPESL